MGVIRPKGFSDWLTYPEDYKPRCGVRCSRCRVPQYDVEVYQYGRWILCRTCFREVIRELEERVRG